MNYGECSVILYLRKAFRRFKSIDKLSLVITSLSTVLYDLIYIQVDIDGYHQKVNIGRDCCLFRLLSLSNYIIVCRIG
jgi:hypothetical protein